MPARIDRQHIQSSVLHMVRRLLETETTTLVDAAKSEEGRLGRRPRVVDDGQW